MQPDHTVARRVDLHHAYELKRHIGQEDEIDRTIHNEESVDL